MSNKKYNPIVSNSINIIVAVSKNNVIGIDGHLPWNLPTEYKYFLDNIKDGIIIEGSKAYSQRGAPLENTFRTIVLSKDRSKIFNGAVKMDNLKDAIKYGLSLNKNKNIWILGGENIYKESIGLVDKLYITTIFKDFSGDRFFVDNWREYFNNNIYKSKIYTENDIDFIFEIYQKNI